MRTTLAIDDDVLAAAKHLATSEHKSIGEVISVLARRGLNPSARGSRQVRNSVPLATMDRRFAPDAVPNGAASLELI